jgi:hypothetical protein
MADQQLSYEDAQFLKRCPQTFIHGHRRTIDAKERARMGRLQALRLISVTPRADLAAGAGHMAEITLTEAGRAALAAYTARRA